MIKKLVFKYLDTKFPNKLEIEEDPFYLSGVYTLAKKYFVKYSGKTICILFIYSSGDKKHYTNSSITLDLESWFGLNLRQLDEMVFEWILTKEPNLLVYHL